MWPQIYPGAWRVRRPRPDDAVLKLRHVLPALRLGAGILVKLPACACGRVQGAVRVRMAGSCSHPFAGIGGFVGRRLDDAVNVSQMRKATVFETSGELLLHRLMKPLV